MTLTHIKSALRDWRDDEEGSIAVEFVLMVPLLSWALLSTIAYFDAYRAEGIANKAGLTIADMFSRETNYITPDYMAGTIKLLRFLTRHDDTPTVRVTAVRFTAADPDNAPTVGAYSVAWSKKRGPGKSALNTAELVDKADELPIMSHSEVAILVETWTDYESPYSVGLPPFTIETSTIISPRFASQVCWNATPDMGAATAVC